MAQLPHDNFTRPIYDTTTRNCQFSAAGEPLPVRANSCQRQFEVSRWSSGEVTDEVIMRAVDLARVTKRRAFAIECAFIYRIPLAHPHTIWRRSARLSHQPCGACAVPIIRAATPPMPHHLNVTPAASSSTWLQLCHAGFYLRRRRRLYDAYCLCCCICLWTG